MSSHYSEGVTQAITQLSVVKVHWHKYAQEAPVHREVAPNWERGAQIWFPCDLNLNLEGHIQLCWQVGAGIFQALEGSSKETCRHHTAWYVKRTKSSWILLQCIRKRERRSRLVGLECPDKLLLNLNHYSPQGTLLLLSHKITTSSYSYPILYASFHHYNNDPVFLCFCFLSYLLY